MMTLAHPDLRDSRAAVFDGPDRPFRLITVDGPPPGADGVLVEVLACTICGSDVHTFCGRRSGPVPTVLGHEIVGRVMAMQGPAPPDVRVGDRISWSVCASCMRCDRCRRGLTQKCRHLRKYGHENLSAWPMSGGLADHCFLRPGTAMARLPAHVTTEVACPFACAGATAAAALSAISDLQGRRVLVFGAGMLGLCAVAMAHCRGAESIVVVDTRRDRVERAEGFGATDLVSAEAPTAPRLLRHVRKALGDDEADVVLEMSGATQAIAGAVDLCAVGGIIKLVGSALPVPAASWLPEQIVRKLIRIEGVHNYTPTQFQQAMRFMADHASDYPFDSLIPHTFPLREVQDAFEYAASSSAVRVAVTPSG